MSNTLCFLVPGRLNKPVGGHKVIYQYANALSDYGCAVMIANCIFEPVPSSFLIKILRALYAILRFVWRRFFHLNTCKRWFPLKGSIKEIQVWTFEKKHMPVSDYYIATDATTSPFLREYRVPASKKIYFIQGYENWRMTDKQLRDTYHIDCVKIVVSNWLGRILKEEGVDYSLVPNGFNKNDFYIDTPIEKRNKYVVSMLYHQASMKNSTMGFKALEIVKQHYPQLQVIVFGVYKTPENLPEWITYYRNPSKELHNWINNESSIYIGTSSSEGFGLTIGEAMMCGQAVACTDTDGYLEMAVDNETALVSPVNDTFQLANNIVRLISDDELRIRIAKKGNVFIQSFSLENSIQLFKSAIFHE